MKRSLSFADLKGLTSGVERELNNGNVRKIQSCAGRFEDSEILSPDFFDELLDEYEQEDAPHHNNISTQLPFSSSLMTTDLSNHHKQRKQFHPRHSPNHQTSRPFFTTHDLTALLSFVQSNPPTLTPSLSASIFPNNPDSSDIA